MDKWMDVGCIDGILSAGMAISYIEVPDDR